VLSNNIFFALFSLLNCLAKQTVTSFESCSQVSRPRHCYKITCEFWVSVSLVQDMDFLKLSTFMVLHAWFILPSKKKWHGFFFFICKTFKELCIYSMFVVIIIGKLPPKLTYHLHFTHKRKRILFISTKIQLKSRRAGPL